MSISADAIIDRRRMARRIAFWRAIAILVVIGAAIGAIYYTQGFDEKHVARLPINGAIIADRPLLKTIASLRKNDSVSGVLVSINSPGGTTVGGERLYNALRDLDTTKPVVTHIGGLGTSAGYMAAISSEHIVAQRTSITGSIGVLIQYGQMSELLDRIGVSVSKVDSGPLKAEPNPFEPTDPAAIAVLQSVVDSTYEWFVDLVEERRPLSRDEIRELADGRIFTGQQALELDLIDAIGGEREAIAWLESERDVPTGLPVRTYEPSETDGFGLGSMLRAMLLDTFFSALNIDNPLTLRHDGAEFGGVWSIWQASDG